MQQVSPAGRPLVLGGARLKILVVGTALVLGVCYLILTGMQTSTVYYLTVGELLAKGPSVHCRQLRVAGDVTPGSVHKDEAGLALRFVIQDDSSQLPVSYRGGPVPDIFGEDVQVVIEGKYAADGTFVASTLLAKCPSKFDSTPDMSA